MACVIKLLVVTYYVRDRVTQDIAARAASLIGVYRDNLISEISKHEVIPQLLASNKQYLTLLNDPGNALQIAKTNKLLEKEFMVTEVLDIFLLNEFGQVIASSNWNKASSYIGEELEFRPYFVDAKLSGTGRYFALGTTSGKRGHYFSKSIEDKQQFKGALVVKVDLTRLEAAWDSGPELITVTDEDSIFFISTEPEWLYRYVQTPSPEALQRLETSRRFADLTPVALKATDMESRIPHASQHEIARDDNDGPPREMLMQSMPLTQEGWKIQIWSDLQSVQDTVNRSQIFTVMMDLSLLLLGALLYHRWRSRLAKQQFDEQAHNMLQSAYGDLESRVRRRTIQLSEANLRLQTEISERKQTEQELRIAQKNLVQSGKMAALGQMATSITHELNQPLGAVRTFADTARTYIDRGQISDASENLDLIARMADRMTEITSHLKSFARKTPSQLGPVHLSSVMQETLLIFEVPIREAGVTVRQTSQIDNATVLAEAGRLQQVFTNLLQNALDALRNSDEKMLSINISQLDENAVLTVRDTGPGFDEDVLGHIFEPFFTTKTSVGLGLGLAISEGIIRDFGGQLEACNVHPSGAEFRIILPLSPDSRTEKEAGEIDAVEAAVDELSTFESTTREVSA